MFTPGTTVAHLGLDVPKLYVLLLHPGHLRSSHATLRFWWLSVHSIGTCQSNELLEAARWTSKIGLFYCYRSSENGLGHHTSVGNFGYSNGTGCILDPADYDRLLPIGAVGKCVLYIPNTASSYLIFQKSPKRSLSTP
ncbi:hypothetical protein FGSG_13817 [Fusarium graminearum PH-1]|uniref:Chromosome 1, complete genome n=1 Tax=Gibberella zeae (strain ATCC MYA-4620 / CBS 123657 / FGSC 9075 / NRRL 31084 / PH-1) TaxID=229533 RepID=I1SAD6_GIBZE|nr:hypothetical protein FGSG_13817 [Fusarium graminearum PH-1]ESU17465.1 hypothetical protein FGSG_13817 [Fusarium graminearum PH-1]CEF76184.1 unnamed protein product [Fusarium graminearum]|eukprot:XP_011319727.1 hypothetical protein FGSG_13817 [Fusarium graminearum PH-1]